MGARPGHHSDIREVMFISAMISLGDPEPALRDVIPSPPVSTIPACASNSLKNGYHQFRGAWLNHAPSGQCWGRINFRKADFSAVTRVRALSCNCQRAVVPGHSPLVIQTALLTSI